MGDSEAMMPNYTTLDELKAAAPDGLLTEVTDVDLGRLLSHASRLIRKHTRHAVYSTDDEHMPTSDTLRGIFREATTAQVVSWVENGMVDDVLSGGVTAEVRVASTSSNGKSISFDHSQSDAARAHLTGGGLGAEAALILDDVGLLGGLPGVYR